MSIRWITSLLGTGPALEVVGKVAGVEVVDVRDLIDKGGNRVDSISEKIEQGVSAIRLGKKTVICCDHGISRSNAIAVGVLSSIEGITVSEAVRRVMAATNNAEIRLDILETVRETVQERSLTNMSSSRRQWLLLGGSGYLGSAIRASAAAEIAIISPSHAELDLSLGGTVIDNFVKDNNIEKILYFASPYATNVNSALGESLSTLRSVLDVCAVNSISLVFPSRWEVFSGYKGSDLLVVEDSTQNPCGVLGDTKYLSEKMIEVYSQRSGVSALILRSALVYGGRSAPNFLRSFIRSAMNDKDIVTHTYINGEPKLDLIYLDDWLAAFWKIVPKESNGVFNLGFGGTQGTGDIAKHVNAIVGGKGSHTQRVVQDAVANVAFDSRRLSGSIEWHPKMDFESGLRNFIQDFIKN